MSIAVWSTGDFAHTVRELPQFASMRVEAGLSPGNGNIPASRSGFSFFALAMFGGIATRNGACPAAKAANAPDCDIDSGWAWKQPAFFMATTCWSALLQAFDEANETVPFARFGYHDGGSPKTLPIRPAKLGSPSLRAPSTKSDLPTPATWRHIESSCAKVFGCCSPIWANIGLS